MATGVIIPKTFSKDMYMEVVKHVVDGQAAKFDASNV